MYLTSYNKKYFLCFIILILTIINIATSKKPPVIAILANPQPIDDGDNVSRSSINYQYIRWLEQSRADVIVIHPWYTEAQIDEMLLKVNGVIWPGGDRDLDLTKSYEKVAKMIIEKIIKIFDEKHISIPLWGTCQGFEMIHVLLADSLDVLTSFPTNNIQTNLLINQTVIEETKMYSNFAKNDIYNLQNKNTTAQFHFLGVDENDYEKYPRLKEILKITSYGKDTEGKNYVASVEGIRYPIYGVQFHPEMVSYTKIDEDGIPQSMEAIRIAQLFSNFFISESRLNNNYMPYEEMKQFDYVNGFEKLPLVDEYYYYYSFDRNKSELKNNLRGYIKFLEQI